MFTNHSTKYIYEKKVEHGSRERKYQDSFFFTVPNFKNEKFKNH